MWDLIILAFTLVGMRRQGLPSNSPLWTALFSQGLGYVVISCIACIPMMVSAQSPLLNLMSNVFVWFQVMVSLNLNSASHCKLFQYASDSTHRYYERHTDRPWRDDLVSPFSHPPCPHLTRPSVITSSAFVTSLLEMRGSDPSCRYAPIAPCLLSLSQPKLTPPPACARSRHPSAPAPRAKTRASRTRSQRTSTCTCTSRPPTLLQTSADRAAGRNLGARLRLWMIGRARALRRSPLSRGRRAEWRCWDRLAILHACHHGDS